MYFFVDVLVKKLWISTHQNPKRNFCRKGGPYLAFSFHKHLKIDNLLRQASFVALSITRNPVTVGFPWTGCGDAMRCWRLVWSLIILRCASEVSVEWAETIILAANQRTLHCCDLKVSVFFSFRRIWVGMLLNCLSDTMSVNESRIRCFCIFGPAKDIKRYHPT